MIAIYIYIYYDYYVSCSLLVVVILLLLLLPVFFITIIIGATQVFIFDDRAYFWHTDHDLIVTCIASNALSFPMPLLAYFRLKVLDPDAVVHVLEACVVSVSNLYVLACVGVGVAASM